MLTLSKTVIWLMVLQSAGANWLIQRVFFSPHQAFKTNNPSHSHSTLHWIHSLKAFVRTFIHPVNKAFCLYDKMGLTETKASDCGEQSGIQQTVHVSFSSFHCYLSLLCFSHWNDSGYVTLTVVRGQRHQSITSLIKCPVGTHYTLRLPDN